MALTRDEMVKIIQVEKGSVMYNGAVIANVSELPNEADLAKGNPEKEAAAKKKLEAEIKEREAQLKSLEGKKEVAKPESVDLDKAKAKKEEVKK